jgi:hypothetical protein
MGGLASPLRRDAIEVLFVRPDLAFARFYDAMILCHSHHAPTDACWDAWIECSLSQHHRAVLVSSHGGGPTPHQRRQLAERRSQAGAGTETVALLSESALLRGVLTAMAWITGNSVKAFAPNELATALAWLGLTERSAEAKTVIAQLHAAMEQATPVNTGTE